MNQQQISRLMQINTGPARIRCVEPGGCTRLNRTRACLALILGDIGENARQCLNNDIPAWPEWFPRDADRDRTLQARTQNADDHQFLVRIYVPRHAATIARCKNNAMQRQHSADTKFCENNRSAWNIAKRCDKCLSMKLVLLAGFELATY